MKFKQNDIVVDQLKEAEERNAPEAKQVEALLFHSKGTGSSPVRSTDNWYVETATTICGRNQGRLGIRT